MSILYPHALGLGLPWVQKLQEHLKKKSKPFWCSDLSKTEGYVGLGCHRIGSFKDQKIIKQFQRYY
jgi:hypothetical protein